LEKSNYIPGFFLGRLVLIVLFVAHISGCIAQHHDKRLEVHAVQDIVHAPSCGTGYLPDKPEGAMGAFPTAL